jgi:hypothetical protein
MPNPSRYAVTVLRISPLCQGFRAHDVIVEANSRTGVPLRVSVSRRGVWLTVIALSLSIVVAVFFAQSGSEKKLLSGLRALDLEVRSEVRQKKSLLGSSQSQNTQKGPRLEATRGKSNPDVTHQPQS